MSDNNFKGVTFAFSRKDKVWRTRYSFTPTAYARVDNILVSTNGRHGADSDSPTPFWRHDVNGVRNNFYGFQYSTSVAFVSNYNPSSVKIFKALSIESNSSSWSGFVSTNINPSGGESINEYQNGAINSFVRKEGTMYAEVPRSARNSTANFSYAFGSISPVNESFPQGSSLDIGLTPANPYVYLDLEVSKMGERIVAGSSNLAIFNINGTKSYITDLGPVGVETSTYQDMVGVAAVVDSYDKVNKIVTVKIPVRTTLMAQYPWSWIDELLVDNNSVYIATSPKLDGDSMRGPYMNVYLTNTSTGPIEAFSFNVDYEPTKLDHSLSQNA